MATRHPYGKLSVKIMLIPIFFHKICQIDKKIKFLLAKFCNTLYNNKGQLLMPK